MGKVYFVTGVNRGIGLSFVAQLASDEDNVVIGSVRNINNAGEALAKLTKEHKNLHLVQLDLGDEQSVAKLDGQLQKLTEGIDVYIANAGYANNSLSPLAVTRAEMIEHFNINTVGSFDVFKVVLPYMRKRETKKACFISSDASSVGKVFTNTTSYGVSKAALNRTMRGVAEELEPEGFIISMIHPGWVETDMFTGVTKDFDDELKAKLKTKSITADTSASQVLGLIETATQESAKTLVNNLGELMSW